MSTLPQGGFGERRGGWRRKPLIIGGVVLVLIVAWSYAVLSYGGGEQARSAAPQKSGATTGEPSSAVPDEPAYAKGATKGSTEGSAESGGASGSADDNAGGGAGQTLPEGQSLSPGAGGQEAHDHPGGATNEPGNYDPLGTGATAGDLVPTDEKRLRFAAERYISAAYGYSGNDKDAYNQGVGATVVWPDFFDSEGSSETERFAKQVEQSGTKSGAVLTEFDPVETTADRATAYAYFETGSGYTKDGGLTGQKQAYRQKMVLVRTGAVWKVRAVEKIEETS